MPRAMWNGTVLAERELVDGGSLRVSDHRSVCPWKGTPGYYDIVVDGEENAGAAWHYPDASRRAAPLVGGRVVFWRGVTVERGGGEPQRRSVLACLAERMR